MARKLALNNIIDRVNKIESAKLLENSKPTSTDPSKTSSPSRVRTIVERAGPPLFYLLMAILFSWPLALHLGEDVIHSGSSGDVWQHLWNNWWMRFSLLDLHRQPYYTPTLFYPDGANLYFHALDPMDGYLSTPFQLLFGLVAAFNLNLLFQLTVAGWGTYLLAHYLTGNRGAALVAGLIYACSPLESELLNLGQLELTSIEWLPLYILCLLKALNGERRPWLWRSLSVGLLLILSLDSWYYVMYALMFTGLFVLYRLLVNRTEWRRTLLVSIGILVVYLVLVSPILLPTIREAGAKGTTQDIFNVIYNSTTVKGLFTTGPSLLWGVFGSGANTDFRGNFLGYIALILAGLGLATSFKKGWFWLGIALVFLVMAFGPVFHFSFNPDWTPKTAGDGVSLPGRLLYNLPLGNISRVPLRFTLITMLALGMLAAYGIDWLARRWSSKTWTQWAVPVVAGLLVCLEFLPGSRGLTSTSVDAFYTQIRNEGSWNDFAVMETPDRGDVSVISPAMYFQTVHQHPIIGGYLSRKPEYNFKDFPGIHDLLNLESSITPDDILAPDSLHNALGILQHYNIRYVIVHPQLLNPAEKANAQAILQTVYGAGTKPYYQDDQLQVWQTPTFLTVTDKPDPTRLLAALNGTWGDPQTGPAGSPERSIKQEGRLNVFNPYNGPMATTMQITSLRAANASDTGQLTALLNGQSVGKASLTASGAPLSANLVLQPGLNEIVLQTSITTAVGAISFR